MTRELVKKVDEFTNGILMDAEDYGTCEGLTAEAVLEELGDVLPKGLRDELVAEAKRG